MPSRHCSTPVDERAFGDLMMGVELADGAAVAEEVAGLAGFGVAADVGGDCFTEAVEDHLK